MQGKEKKNRYGELSAEERKKKKEWRPHECITTT
jgi:hypothetical protein